MLYEGSSYTRDRVEEVRRSLSSGDEFPIVYNPPAARMSGGVVAADARRNGGGGGGERGGGLGTPPPPYTPTIRVADRVPQISVSSERIKIANSRTRALNLLAALTPQRATIVGR